MHEIIYIIPIFSGLKGKVQSKKQLLLNNFAFNFS